MLVNCNFEGGEALFFPLSQYISLAIHVNKCYCKVTAWLVRYIGREYLTSIQEQFVYSYLKLRIHFFINLN